MSALSSYPASASPTSTCSTTRPATFPVCFDAIPQELTLLPQWVVWRWEFVESKQKWKKPPFDPKNGRRAEHSNAATWGTFNEAVVAYQRGGFDGIGFVFTPTDPYAGIDLDDCRNPTTGVIDADSWNVVCEVASYTEVSPSATGLKAIVRAKLPLGRRKGRVGGIKTEMYDENRYFTLTGWRLDQFPIYPVDRQAEVAALHSRLLPPPKKERAAAVSPSFKYPVGGLQPVALNDSEIISLLRSTPSGRTLWEGKASLWSGSKPLFLSQSEADLALVGRIAQFTTDSRQLDDLFRASGLFRDKWDESHSTNGGSYGAMTIAIALQSNQPIPIIETEPFKRSVGKADPISLLPLSVYRRNIEVLFHHHTALPGVVLMNSPCGTSKTYSLMQRLLATPTSLIVTQSHKNCQETANTARDSGLDCMARPYLQKKNCDNSEEAKQDEKRGLPVLETTCKRCPYRAKCDVSGYRAELKQFDEAPHQVVTAARLNAVGLLKLAQHKQVVSILEDVANTIRPATAVSVAKLTVVRILLSDLSRSDDRSVGSYASSLLKAVYEPLDQVIRLQSLAQLVVPCIDVERPRDWYLAIKDAIQHLGISSRGTALHAVMGIAEGRRTAVYRPKRNGLGGHPDELVVTHRNDLLPWMMNILEDATVNLTTVERLLGVRPVTINPSSFPEPLQRVVQIPVDITKEQKARTANIVRAILLLRPQAQRVGVICHLKHKTAVNQLKKTFPNRIVKIDHFRSGPSRGSNDWYKTCDLLLVVGTHRPGDAAVQLRLIAEGNLTTARQQSDLARVVHIGLTESGQRMAFLSLRHTDPEWDRVHTELVHAESLQNVGRGRHILPKGIPETIVVSNENLEIPLWDDDFHPVSAAEADLYFHLLNLAALPSGGFLNSHGGGGIPATLLPGQVRASSSIYIRDSRAPSFRLTDKDVPEKGIPQRELARHAGIADGTARGRIKSLLKNKLVVKCPITGLWPLIPQFQMPVSIP